MVWLLQNVIMATVVVEKMNCLGRTLAALVTFAAALRVFEVLAFGACSTFRVSGPMALLSAG